MDGWSIALLAVAGYLAVTALVRLMIRHRNQLVDEFRRQLQSGQTPRQSEPGELRPPEQEKKAA